jgi:spermidine/putrescine transport system permease protein
MLARFWNTTPQGPLEYGRRLWLRSLLASVFFFLYAPIMVLIVFSFNDSKRNIVWQGFTLKNYAVAWNNADLFDALTNSLIIAGVSTLFATIIGAMVGVQLWRFRFPGKPAYEGFMALPIVIPEITMGVALMAFFFKLGWMTTDFGWPFNLFPIIIAHIAFCFPFVAIVVRSRMAGFNLQLEEASKDLGASQWQTFRFVLLPFMKPGLVAGALLAFTLSLDDFVITYFTSGPGSVTFPVKVFSLVRRGVTPDINAASTVLIIITVVATVIAMKLQAPEKSGEAK